MFFTVFDNAGVKKELNELKELSGRENFWDDNKKAGSVLKRQNYLEEQLKKCEDFKARLELLEFMMGEVKQSPDFDEVFEKEAIELFEDVRQFKTLVLLGGKFDSHDAVLSIQAGAGGVDSQDWAEMLLRMYIQFANKNGFKITVTEREDGNEAGIKGVTLLVEGQNAFGYLKNESGVHRLVRISPFDSAKRRHTSFASVDVSPHVDDEIRIEIKDSDVRVDTFRSGGAGGQHVNKTESAVRLTHIPSGITVVCQSGRSSHQNKDLAFKILHGKLLAEEERRKQAEKDAKNNSLKKIEWGSQIRSYVFCPYTMVKDHRTNFETSDVEGVMNGDLMEFMEEMIAMQST